MCNISPLRARLRLLRTLTRFERQASNPGLASLMEMWTAKIQEPYFGVTSDGKLRDDLYKLQDEGAPVEEATRAAEELLQLLTAEQMKSIQQNLDSSVWRRWANR